MSQTPATARYRFGTFEADAATGELRRQGLRVRLAAQPFQMLLLLLERPGELLTREEICRALWPEGTFVDYEHGVNSAVNRIREALGDAAGNPRFIETLARRGYRFIAPVERMDAVPVAPPPAENGFAARILATEKDLPQTSPWIARTLFILLQLMYLGFYVGALANLAEIDELLAPLPHPAHPFLVLVVTAAILIPVRVFLGTAVLFQAPGFRGKFMRIWPFLLLLDVLWSLSPFLLLHHTSVGVALACTVLLVYSPFAQRSLVLMGAAGPGRSLHAGAS
ncbi:MAG TPA: winged helix-turn-helix domain-containing protein [Terracidiphilus sp.]|jgi:DNA-binding winged helix-turn-helix (wHTH) protein|nr:winged helix-turn-helix domain-containing protein [Terracidiphilus sp.]